MCFIEVANQPLNHTPASYRLYVFFTNGGFPRRLACQSRDVLDSCQLCDWKQLKVAFRTLLQHDRTTLIPGSPGREFGITEPHFTNQKVNDTDV